VISFGVIAAFTQAFRQAAPVAGLAGGLLIGLAASLMLLGLGRIAGVSGLFARATAMADAGPPRLLALAFVLGLPLGARLLAQGIGGVPVRMPGSVLTLVIGGLLVGFGTRLGSGCTSGHGVCGLSRLSPRSAVATLLFMGAGFVTVAVSRVVG
jgi:uncharacterized membrane protein YedE/YeeE